MFFFHPTTTKRNMGNWSAKYDPLSVGSYVSNSIDAEQRKQSSVKRLEQSLRDLKDSEKITSRKQQLAKVRAEDTAVCPTIKGKNCEAWCARKMSQCILLPSAVKAYLEAVKDGVWQSPNPKKKHRKPTSPLTPVERANTRVYEHTVLTMMYKAWPLMLDVDPPILPDGNVGDDFFTICRASRLKKVSLESSHKKGDRVRVKQYMATVTKVYHDGTYDVDLDTLSCAIVDVEHRIRLARMRRGDPRTVSEASAYLDDLILAVKDFEDHFFQRLKTWQKPEDIDGWIERNYGTVSSIASFVLSFAIYYFILYAVIPTSVTVAVSSTVKLATGSSCIGTISMTTLPDVLSRSIDTDMVTKSLGRMPFFKKEFSAMLNAPTMTVAEVLETFQKMTGAAVETDKLFVGTYNALLGYLKSTATTAALQYAGVPFLNIC